MYEYLFIGGAGKEPRYEKYQNVGYEDEYRTRSILKSLWFLS
jgi:hypothetical protein